MAANGFIKTRFYDKIVRYLKAKIMAGDQDKDKDQKTPEKPEGQKPPEGQKKPEDKDTTVHAAARMEWKDFMSKEGLDRIQKIQERKKQIEEEQKKLQDEARTKRDKESWINNPASSPVFNPRGTISEKVEQKSGTIKSKLDTAGLGNDTNINAVKQVLKDIVYDQYTKTGKDEAITTAFADSLDGKITYLFEELNKIFESKKHPFGKPEELVENFSEFTGTNFCKKGFLQAAELKDFFLLERSNYESFITGYGKYLGLGVERKQLEGEETTLMGKGLEPRELIEQKKITFTKTRFTSPKDGKDLDKVLQEEIPKALPPIADAATKQKIVDYLAGEVKKMNPQPDEVFELSPDGKWTKIDTASENKSKDDAKTDAEKQVAETAAATSTDSKPFNFKDSFKSFGETIMEFLRWILGLFGMKLGGGGVEDLLTEWKDITPEEKNQIKEFYGAGKKYFSKMDNINKMLKSPDETRKMLAAKKTDTKENETWDGWIQRHLSEPEKSEISFSTTIEAKNVAGFLVSENGPDDQPAMPLQQEQPGQQKQTPDAAYKPGSKEAGNERAKLIMDRLETETYGDELKALMEKYIAAKGRPEVKEAIAKTKAEGKKLNMREYMEVLTENFLRDRQDIAEKYQKGEISLLDTSEAIYDDIFRFASAEAKTPQEKQQVEKILTQFKATLAQIMAEKGKPGSPQPKQDPDVTYKSQGGQPGSGFLSTSEARTMGTALYGNAFLNEGVVGAAAQMDAALDKMDKDPWMVALKTILDAYILDKAPAALSEKYKKVKEDPSKKIYIDGYMELLGEMYFQRIPGTRERFEKGEIRSKELFQKVYEDLHQFTVARTKTPDERQKAMAVLGRFKEFIDTIDDTGRATKPAAATPAQGKKPDEPKPVTS